MAKLMLSIGDQCFNLLAEEAKRRDITVQQLIRAVVLPDWIKQNIDQTVKPQAQVVTRQPMYIASQSPILPAPIGRLRP